MDVVNCPALTKTPRILNFLVLVSVLYTMLFAVRPAEGNASWNCFRTLHRQAISDAVGASPTDLKKVLIPLEGIMLRQVDVIRNTPKPDRKSFESYYKNILDAAKDNDPVRREYMAKNMVDITTSIFDAYCPLKVSFCDGNEILKRAVVVYDGYNHPTDYSVIPSPVFDTRQQLSGTTVKMLPFYNRLVNEILDLWVTLWKEAGRDISGLPVENALIRSPIIKEREKSKTAGNSGRLDGRGASLQKHDRRAERTTIHQIAEDRKKLAEIKMKIQDLEKAKKSSAKGGHKDDKRLDDELRRLYIEMDHLELRLIKSETD
jgi:hypothetical protein